VKNKWLEIIEAGRPQAGDTEVVQAGIATLKIVNVHCGVSATKLDDRRGPARPAQSYAVQSAAEHYNPLLSDGFPL